MTRSFQSEHMRARVFYLIFLLLLFPLTAFSEKEHRHLGARENTEPAVAGNHKSEDWCFGRLNEDEKRKVADEIRTLHSNYQASRNTEELKKGLSILFENHSRTGDSKKQAELVGILAESLEILESENKTQGTVRTSRCNLQKAAVLACHSLWITS